MTAAPTPSATGPLSASICPAWACPAWIAHRGAGKLAPENTRAAFERGAAHGYTAFECDVKLSRDGVLFLLHDDDLDRTSTGRGPAAARDWAELAGLDAGADDYILKPFEMDELAARLRSAIRSHSGRIDPVLRSGPLALHPDTKVVTKDGAVVGLSAREFALLELLMRRPGVPLSRAQLEERLLGWGEEVASNALEVNIHNLRRKLGPECILNIRGVGYFVTRDEQPWAR